MEPFPTKTMKHLIPLSAAALILLGGCGGSTLGSGGGGGGGSSVGRIAFCDKEGTRLRIWAVALPSTDVKLQAASTTASNEMPALSPDGTKLAFISNRSGSREVYVMTVNQDASLTRLTFDSVEDRNPTWISNSRIAWSKAVGGSDREIVAMNIDGSGFLQLTSNGVEDDFPAAARDGSQVAYIQLGAGSGHAIHRLPAGGGASTLVANIATNRPSLAWQDSSSLLYTALNAGVESCARMSSTGASPTVIIEGWGPRVSAGGGRIIFARTHLGLPQLFTSTLSGGDVRLYSQSAEGVFGWDWRG